MTRSMKNAVRDAKELARHDDNGEAFIKVRVKTFRALPKTGLLVAKWDCFEPALDDGWELAMKITVP